jgi:butyrate kinase
MKKEVILVINPGSTSTKIGLYDRSAEIISEKIDHTGTEISEMHSIRDQLPLRTAIIEQTYQSWLNDYKLVAVVGRGGVLKPLEGGVYHVTPELIEDALSCKYGSHASNMCSAIVLEIAEKAQVPAFAVDPVTVDELLPEARISGIPEIQRRSRLHALNVNACARKETEKMGKSRTETHFVVAHLGGGITVAAVDRGRIIDCNDALLGMGPFSPERAGALPLEGLLNLAYSGQYSLEDLKKKLSKSSGLKAYLGTNNVKEILQRINKGDSRAELILKAMLYQVAKEIGAMATTLSGKIDRVILTGGMAHSEYIVSALRAKVGFLAEISVYPGENELAALAAGGFRVIDSQEEAKTYLT